MKLYELNLNGIDYWKKRENPETLETTFVKDNLNSFTLFLDNLGNPKAMPKTEGSYYIDLISGRVISLIKKAMRSLSNQVV